MTNKWITIVLSTGNEILSYVYLRHFVMEYYSLLLYMEQYILSENPSSSSIFLPFCGPFLHPLPPARASAEGCHALSPLYFTAPSFSFPLCRSGYSSVRPFVFFLYPDQWGWERQQGGGGVETWDEREDATVRQRQWGRNKGCGGRRLKTTLSNRKIVQNLESRPRK